MSIHHEVVVTAAPARVFEALTSSAGFTQLTGGAPATIESGDGGAFSLFGGAIHGRNVELVAGTRVVQAWRVKAWEPGHYSVVWFELSPEGSGTRVSLDQVGYPAEHHDHLSSGWVTNYLDPLAKL